MKHVRVNFYDSPYIKYVPVKKAKTNKKGIVWKMLWSLFQSLALYSPLSR